MAVQCTDVNALMVDNGVPVGKVKFYMPPEVFARQPYSPAKVDVWTSGIILFVMLTKVHPFKYASAADARFMMVYSGKMNELLRRWGKEPLHPHAEDLLRRMLCPPEARISVDDILQHPYVREEPPRAERTLSTVDEDGKWQEPPQHRPQLQHAASSYAPNPSPPSSARNQVLSPTSPSYNLPSALPVYPTVPVSASASSAPRPIYPPPTSSATSAPAPLPQVPSAYSAQPPYPPSSSAQQPQPPRASLQPAYHHPLGQPPSTALQPSNMPAYPAAATSQPVPQPSQSHLVHLLQHHRPPPLAPTSQPASQALPQHYSRAVPTPGHYSGAPDMMQ